MLLSVEQAFVGRERNPIFPKNGCVGGHMRSGFQNMIVRNRPLAVNPLLKRGTPYYP